MSATRKIKRVYTADQMASNTEGAGYCVGWKGVTEIREVQENLGTYGILWFEAYIGDVCIGKINALQVLEVEYFHE